MLLTWKFLSTSSIVLENHVKVKKQRFFRLAMTWLLCFSKPRMLQGSLMIPWDRKGSNVGIWSSMVDLRRNERTAPKTRFLAVRVHQKYFFLKTRGSEPVFNSCLGQFALYFQFESGASKSFGWKWAFFAETDTSKTWFWCRGNVQSFSKIENLHAPSNPFTNADAAMVRKFKSKLPLLKYRQNWDLRRSLIWSTNGVWSCGYDKTFFFFQIDHGSNLFN